MTLSKKQTTKNTRDEERVLKKEVLKKEEILQVLQKNMSTK